MTDSPNGVRNLAALSTITKAMRRAAESVDERARKLNGTVVVLAVVVAMWLAAIGVFAYMGLGRPDGRAGNHPAASRYRSAFLANHHDRPLRLAPLLAAADRRRNASGSL
jgi:hypothetical protein